MTTLRPWCVTCLPVVVNQPEFWVAWHGAPRSMRQGHCDWCGAIVEHLAPSQRAAYRAIGREPPTRLVHDTGCIAHDFSIYLMITAGLS